MDLKTACWGEIRIYTLKIGKNFSNDLPSIDDALEKQGWRLVADENYPTNMSNKNRIYTHEDDFEGPTLRLRPCLWRDQYSKVVAEDMGIADGNYWCEASAGTGEYDGYGDYILSFTVHYNSFLSRWTEFFSFQSPEILR